MGRTAATSTISAVPGSSNGRACSTGTGIVAGTVGLTGGGAEDDGSLLHEDKDVEEIAHEEVLPTQHGGDPMQSTDTSVLASSSMTTTAKKRGKKRPKGEPALEAEASVSTPKKRAPRVPKSPAKRRKVDAPTPVKVEEEDNNLAKETDLPKPPKRRKRNPPIPIKVEEGADSLATTITSGDTPKTPKKRGRPSRMNKDTADTTTPVSSTKPKSTAPVKRRKTVKGGVKGPMETSVDDQPNLVAEAEPISSATVAARKGRVKDTTSSSSPAKRKRRASVDGSPSKKRRYGPVKSEHVEPLSIRPTSFPLLEIPSSNTPSLWASDKTDLMILTSKLNMVTTIFVDQESAIGIAIQDDGEMELTMSNKRLR
ncbi:uncharacterized protein EV420DRAFT_1184317 [Desarmillaria tabescens]|uniref:Uncharacterized protein n=1 Tax=Armillaria tabescens TaxID=1929756 RepID=A0AA39NB50_ARMTA|nr:uncharacterized protein EV420DRAFT_1184317 [Desarmillaria tabescens]KAK0462380.1 hypothetical protein EV420DRAFT_1184317 [Desarmillaria tabescens]